MVGDGNGRYQNGSSGHIGSGCGLFEPHSGAFAGGHTSADSASGGACSRAAGSGASIGCRASPGGVSAGADSARAGRGD